MTTSVAKSDAAVGTDQTAAARHPLLGIEVLRFACTVPILLLHYQHFYHVGLGLVGFDATKQPLFWLLKPFYLYGYFAVQVFWGLSGFIFYWKYANPIRQGTVRFGRFVNMRFSRLYPLHLLTLLIVALLAWRYQQIQGSAFVYGEQNARHFVMQLFMASNWTSSAGSSYNAPIWSVSAEVAVYLIFFGLCRIGVTRTWMLIALTVATGWLRVYYWKTDPIVECMFLFYLGTVTGRVYQALIVRPARTKHVATTVGLAVLAVGTMSARSGFIDSIQYVQSMMPVLIVVLVLTVHPRRDRTCRTIETLGNLTYSSYLWHFPIQLLVALLFIHDPTRMPRQSVLFLFGFLAVTYIVAALSFRFIEKPAQEWLRSHLGSKSRCVEAAGPAIRHCA